MQREDFAGRCDQRGMVVQNKMTEAREERISRYKEERRRQLATQFGPRDHHQDTSNTPVGIRSTRASRLRSQANLGESSGRSCEMVSPKVAGVCSPRTKKPNTTSSSPIPRSSQLVKIASRNERGISPDNSNIKQQSQRISSLVCRSTPSSPSRHPSILKKSSLDESLSQTPISILKRKTSNEEQARCNSPLRFAPDTTEQKGRGILKKHRSLDEPQTNSHVLIEPLNIQSFDDPRSFRRCSLDEVKRNISPEPQGILKRKASREEVEQAPSQEPHGILKKKSSVIEELMCENLDAPRPILKKKSFSEDGENPRVRPILKTWKRSESMGDNDNEVRPILKNNPEVVMRPKRPQTDKRVVSLDLSLLKKSAEEEGKRLSVAERINGLESFMTYIRNENPHKMEDEKNSTGTTLVRSGSVSEKASIFNQMDKNEGNSNPRRIKGQRVRSNKTDVSRFCTQPVTLDEVEKAKRNNDCDEADPSKLTLAQRVALFSKKGNEEVEKQPPPPPPKRLINKSMSGVLVEGLMKNLVNKEAPKLFLKKPLEPRDDVSTSSSSDEETDLKKENKDFQNLLKQRKDDAEETYQQNKIRNIINKSVASSGPTMAEVSALRRCATQPIPRDEVDDHPTASIAERLAALKKNGDCNWMKRIAKPNATEEIVSSIPPSGSSTRVVSERMGQLEIASHGWKSRVEAQDAVQFTVAGKMSETVSVPEPNLGARTRKPKPIIFAKNGSASTPSVPDSLAALMKRSISVPEDKELTKDNETPLVQVPMPYDEDFLSFFTNPDLDLLKSDIDIDLGEVQRNSQMLIQRRNVKVQRKHRTTNPLKALAARTDLKAEYSEIKIGVAEREIRRINIEKLSKNCGLAVEALAGLASKEDISAISLRKAADGSSASKQWNHPLLLRIKGRRRPLTTIVKPHYSTINQGDSFILVTQNKVYHWVGSLANVIEKSRGADIALHIQTKKDLGCSAQTVYTLDGSLTSERHKEFWTLLSLPDNLNDSYKGQNAGHPNEDEVYEKAISETFTVYSLNNDKLVPVDSFWGKCPKIEILEPSKVLVFDFGSEVYTWAGKNVDLPQRRQGAILAQELYKGGYSNAFWLPTQIDWLDKEMECESRPDWSVIAKVTQHMEPIVFKEKFVDWPDFSRVIKTKDSKDNKTANNNVSIRSCDLDAMIEWSIPYPDLILESTHLGRGKHYYDEERRLHYDVSTKDLDVWRIRDASRIPLKNSSHGNFQDDESYILRWRYSVATSVRELSGLPSKHVDTGRDRSAIFVWHGYKAPPLEQGTATLLTSQLEHGDTEGSGPIITVQQGTEGPGFISIFPGPVVFHKSAFMFDYQKLYLIIGEYETECVLEQVPCLCSQLRSSASLWLIKDNGDSYLWHGAKVPFEKQQIASNAINFIIDNNEKEFNIKSVKEIKEGDEPNSFFSGSIDRQSYNSLLNLKIEPWTPRLFHLSSLHGEFTANSVVPFRHDPDKITPYPYKQEALYSTSQPSLMLLDTNCELWLWSGWWEGEIDARGTAWQRFQSDTKAAMTTAIQYWSKRGKDAKDVYIVYAGLEPVKFISFFPTWENNINAKDFNILEGHKDGEIKSVQEELALLDDKFYPISELTSYPLPSGVDPTRLECYLEINDFEKLLGMTKEEFSELPAWKRTHLKKTACLF